jgi:hypothetical protein
MKHLHLLTLAAATLCLTSCETVPAYDSGSKWRTTDNGVTVWSIRNQNVTRHLWEGPVNAEKQAHGFGKISWYNPETSGDVFFGGGYYANTTSSEGRMVNGKLEGEAITRWSYNGKTQRDQFANGEWVSGEVIQTGRSSSGSSGGLSDGQLVGGMLGMAGIAGGDTGLAGAGLTMLSGNESGGFRQMTDWATSTPGGTSGGSGTVAAAGAAGVSAPGGNLIDEWKLRGAVKAGGDHLKYYIQSADQAFASYKKSGDAAYYKQHREYAELARDFHQRTGTKTQGYAR